MSLVGLLGSLALAGCSGSSSIPATSQDRVGPHQGVLVELPDGAGYAEILNSQANDRRSSGRGRPPTQVLVYLLSPDLNSPATTTATDASVKLTLVTNQPMSVPLEPSPEAGDPLGKNRLASKPGPYHLPDVHGELSATLDGRPFSAEFDGSR
jgi:hypothetical protein